MLDKAKEVCGVRTDGELAAKLGVSKQAMSGYRTGVRLPDPVVCATIAGITGIPLAKVLGVIGEARAISREEKAVWRKLAATAAMVLLLASPMLAARVEAATLAFHAVTSHDIHYAKWHVRLARAVLAFFRPAVTENPHAGVALA